MKNKINKRGEIMDRVFELRCQLALTKDSDERKLITDQIVKLMMLQKQVKLELAKEIIEGEFRYDKYKTR